MEDLDRFAGHWVESEGRPSARGKEMELMQRRFRQEHSHWRHSKPGRAPSDLKCHRHALARIYLCNLFKGPTHQWCTHAGVLFFTQLDCLFLSISLCAYVCVCLMADLPRSVLICLFPSSLLLLLCATVDALISWLTGLCLRIKSKDSRSDSCALYMWESLAEARRGGIEL